MSVQDHIHIQLTTGTAESGRFRVKHGNLDDTPIIPASVDRALNATPHLQRIVDDATGDPKIIGMHQMTIICDGMAELEVLKALVARPIYYIPFDHGDDGDAANHTNARRSAFMLIKPGSVTNIDPGLQYWLVGVEIGE